MRITEKRGKAPSWFWQQTEDDQFEMLAFDQRKRQEIEHILDLIRKGEIKLWDVGFAYQLMLAQRLGG